MFSRIHFLHEILLNLLISCRKNKVSYHIFLLLLLVHEVYIKNQELRIEKYDWSIQISYALNISYVLRARGIRDITNPRASAFVVSRA